MPFKSEKQRRYLFKFEPEIAKEFAKEEKKQSWKKFKMKKSKK